MPVIKVSGDVSAITSGAQWNIIKFWESYDFKGQERHRIWTAWMDAIPEGLAEGDWIEIQGTLGTKVSTYSKPGDDTPRSVVEHALNECNIVRIMPKVVTAPTPAETEAPF
jgi:hypothetical protein